MCLAPHLLVLPRLERELLIFFKKKSTVFDSGKVVNKNKRALVTNQINKSKRTIFHIPVVLDRLGDALVAELHFGAVNALLVEFTERVQFINWFALAARRHGAIGEHQAVASVY